MRNNATNARETLPNDQWSIHRQSLLLAGREFGTHLDSAPFLSCYIRMPDNRDSDSPLASQEVSFQEKGPY